MLRTTWNLTCLVLLVCAGCGKTATGVAVSGKVTDGGEPVNEATIVFKPQKGTTGPVRSSPVTSGRYDIPASEGLTEGRYFVEVTLSGPPSRKAQMREGSKKLRKPGEPSREEREVTGPSTQIDIEL
jgi:hypothetical protein